MEEKAPIAGQETTGNEERKLSYEELMNVAMQLQQQNQQLQNQLRQNNGIEKRLYYLFEILKYADMFGDYTVGVVNEIKDIMTIPEQTGQPAEKEGK